MKYVLLGFVILGFIGVGYNMLTATNYPDTQNMSGRVAVNATELSPLAAKGEEIFKANCASCHGENAGGSDSGPPLVHDIYNPGHHGDGAFLSAAQNGVPQHHWNFGNMPPQPDMTQLHIAAIVKYIRELQVANGVEYQAHNM
ncbi:c-type cytochrome [Maritalea sp. S77]|uniref:c-type cytochrome n=1 Tax=Maritalea sp. S77 TaxID=3415125 RepID=UPI003C7E91F3